MRRPASRPAWSTSATTAFRVRLDVLCRALLEEAGLSPMGVVSWYSQLVQFLKNRLLVADLLARHPEIHDIRIARPIIICGLPRTGDDPLAQPDRRPIPLFDPCPTGRASSRCWPPVSSRPRGARPATGPDRRRARRAQLGPAVLQAHARDDRRPRARGDPTPGHGHLVDAVRDTGTHALVAGSLQGRGPDAPRTSTCAPS